MTIDVEALQELEGEETTGLRICAVTCGPRSTGSATCHMTDS
ncbi:ALQxL family class IV lanthipeptide [Kitasatospora sp. NPDC088346]